MKFGYHTAALPHHDPIAAVETIAELGFDAAVIPLHRRWMQAEAAELATQVGEVCRQAKLMLFWDADGNYLSDHRRRSSAALDDPNVPSRVAEVEGALRLAVASSALLVTFSAGGALSAREAASALEVRDQAAIGDQETRLERMGGRIDQLLQLGKRDGVRLALRPCGMGPVRKLAQFEQLLQWVRDPECLELAADMNAMWQEHELPMGARLQRWQDRMPVVFAGSASPDAAIDVTAVAVALDGERWPGCLVLCEYPDRSGGAWKIECDVTRAEAALRRLRAR